MKSIFFKRIGAYLFDFIFITFIVSLITVNFKVNTNVVKEVNDLINNVNKEEISIDDYSNKIVKINYDYQKSIVSITIVNVIISFIYFVIFATLNKGQTLGKKIFKIRVVNKDKERPSIWNMLIRSIFLYGMLINISSIICVYCFDYNIYNYIFSVTEYICYLFVIICFFMVIKRKDGRGLHDLMSKTSVIGEVR